MPHVQFNYYSYPRPLSTPATPSFCCLVSCLGPWVGLFAFVMPTPTWPDCHLWTKDGRLPTESPIGFKPLLRVRPAQGSHRRGHQGLDGQVVGVVDGSLDGRQGFPAALNHGRFLLSCLAVACLLTLPDASHRLEAPATLLQEARLCRESSNAKSTCSSLENCESARRYGICPEIAPGPSGVGPGPRGEPQRLSPITC